jgi:hypothetical protein
MVALLAFCLGLCAACGVGADRTVSPEPTLALPVVPEEELPIYAGQTISVVQEFDEGGLSPGGQCPNSTTYCRSYHRNTLDQNGLVTKTIDCVITTPGDANRFQSCLNYSTEVHQLEETKFTQVKASVVASRPHLFRDRYSCADEYICGSDEYGLDYRIHIDGVVKTVKLWGGDAGISDPSFYNFRRALREVGFQGPYEREVY